MRSSRRATASKTLTVPATLTRIPSGGFVTDERDLERGEMDDARHLVLFQRVLELGEIRDVAWTTVTRLRLLPEGEPKPRPFSPRS